jgi:fused signal recognition particle receptor
MAGQGKKVMLAAGDTFRAAAAEQLEVWGKRAGCPVVRGKEGGDPSSVIFEAVKRGVDEQRRPGHLRHRRAACTPRPT